MLDPAFTEFRQVVRSLFRRPVYAGLTLTLLTLGLGAASTILAVVDATLLRPLPYEEPSDLFAVWGTPRNDPTTRNPISALQLRSWRGVSRAFAGIEALTPIQVTLKNGSGAESLRGGQVSAGLFQLLGVAPRVGRAFRPEEEAPASGVAIISDGFWQRRFGRDPAVVGASLSLNDEPRVIVGVMPPGFAPLLQEADVWIPIPIGPALLSLTNYRYLLGVARLRPGFTLQQASAELKSGSQQLAAELPGVYGNTAVSVVPLSVSLFGAIRPQVIGLAIAVGLLLLIACANVINLALADSAARRHEVATRIALGARRPELIRRRLVETLILALAAAAIGLGVGQASLALLQAVNADAFTGFGIVSVNGLVILLVLGSAVAAGLVAATPAALSDAAGSVASVAGAATKATMTRGDRRVRDALITGQVAIAVVLVAGGVLLVDNVRRLLRTSPGFTPDNVLVAPLSISAARYPTPEARAAYVDRVTAALRDVPGVAAAATTQTRFVLNENMQTLFEIEGRPPIIGQDDIASIRHVTPDLFATLGIPVVEGRAFNATDRQSAPGVAVVSRSFARRYWPAESALGKRVRRGGRNDAPWLAIVGVVEDVMDIGIGVPLGPTLYVSYLQNNTATARVTAVVRTQGNPLALQRGVREAIRSVDPDQAIQSLDALPALLVRSAGVQRFQALVVGFFAGSALVLVLSGIYASTLYAVSRRTREIGVRAALGADAGRLIRIVVGDSIRASFIGAVIGLGVAELGVSSFQRVLTQSLPAVNVGLLVVVGVVLLACTAVAAFIPARRALRIPLVTALRA